MATLRIRCSLLAGEEGIGERHPEEELDDGGLLVGGEGAVEQAGEFVERDRLPGSSFRCFQEAREFFGCEAESGSEGSLDGGRFGFFHPIVGP